MKTRAAVALEARKPFEIVEADLEGPKSGEVLVEIKATGICHTDAASRRRRRSDLHGESRARRTGGRVRPRRNWPQRHSGP